MARIRTIKPEFFTSADIVARTPLARLLYVALWCEADREGRMVWKPATFKLRYLPGDNCDAAELCAELVDAGLVVLYGDGYAYIPAFHAHQHLNPRESATQLPDPHAIATRPARVGTRQPRDPHAQGGREGKGKEGNEKPAMPFPVPDWMPEREWIDFLAHRKAMRGVPFTDAAKTGVIRELEKLKAKGHDPADLLSTAVTRGWRTVFEPKAELQRFTNPADVARLTVPARPRSADSALAQMDRDKLTPEERAAAEAKRLEVMSKVKTIGRAVA